MATILENIQKARFLPTRPLKDDLPTFQGSTVPAAEESHLMGLRKRLSSISGKIQPISSASAEWAFRRSQSAPSLAAAFGAGAGPIKRWWDWGLGWLLSKKLGFAGDLEMNEEEVAALGRQSKGTWAHVLYKMRSGVRRFVVSNHSLPTTQSYKHSGFFPGRSYYDRRLAAASFSNAGSFPAMSDASLAFHYLDWQRRCASLRRSCAGSGGDEDSSFGLVCNFHCVRVFFA